MKYLCIVYADEKVLEAMSPAEWERLTSDHLAYDEELQRNGQHIVGEALQPPSAAVTVRVRGGKVATTDGPFAETKEQLGGIILIEARDLNDAIRLAAKIPSARHGSIEVRPVWDLRGTERRIGR